MPQFGNGENRYDRNEFSFCAPSGDHSPPILFTNRARSGCGRSRKSPSKDSVRRCQPECYWWIARTATFRTEGQAYHLSVSKWGTFADGSVRLQTAAQQIKRRTAP